MGGGKGGSSAPPPDPRLVEGQLKSMGIQDRAIEQMMQNNADMAPLQKQQLEKSLKYADEDRAYTTERRGILTGFQDKATKAANEFNEEGKAAEYGKQADADINAGYSSAMGMNTRNMQRMGGNMYGGKYASMMGGMGLGKAAASADAGFKVRQAAKAEGLALNDRASNMLAGFPSMSMGTSGTGMQYANAGLAGMNSGWGAASGAAGGMGSNATGMYGAQASYKNQQDQINKGDSFGDIAGGIAGLAGAGMKAYAMFGSDRRLKRDVKLVGNDGRTGLNLYEFSYIKDPDAKRYRGVMADEVLRVDPQAVQFDRNGMAMVNYGRLGLNMVEV